MHFFENYYENIVKYDLVNKFHYDNIKKLPKLQKTVLDFGIQSSDFKYLVSALLSLEIITSKKAVATISKRSNILLKIRKGYPVGCKVVLKKKLMFKFLAKLTIDIFPCLKSFTGLTIKEKKINTISYKLTNLLIFSELEHNYKFFKNLPGLNITFVTNSKSQKEFLFLLKSLKIPIVY